MEQKTFESFSVQEAMKAVKRDLGADAVILNTRERSIPGRGKVYEVTAAAPTVARGAGASVQFSGIATQVGRDIEERLSGLDIKVSSLMEALPTKRSVQNLEASVHEIKMLLLESLREKDGSTLKDLPAHLVNIERQLHYTEVSDSHTAQLMKHLRALPLVEGDVEALEDEARAQAIRWMLKRIRIAPRWNVGQGATSVQVLVGPTGSGKSSVTAKLAALYQAREKSKVLLVSYDATKLGAAEQLRIYAKILNIPFATIQTADELPQKLVEHRDAELVIVDTAGRSAKAEDQIQDLLALKKLTLPVDFHLVLSTTERSEQLDSAVRNFGALGIQSLIFSKLDECWNYGEIFNVSSKWSLPLSFFATGQRVPESVERASRERVIERIFGL